ncbi:putative bifunctional diguanylate cyclase/phosphodiesterase [Paraburkholderia acidisoli]|uniref:EAL domain-containing protein n=1 Tax=Paraburkholderia acidisoli TaxID=2571748 RepID=A0A7Z2GR68_9BURK|nr:EAL domain-containing protein [Paraburkholderia acidisoli]QGZ66423.1 EAL domain-containing protein [Paraburkholderia acidisoli]
MNVAENHNLRATRAWKARRFAGRSPVITLAVVLVLCLSVSAAITAALTRGAQDRELQSALGVTAELETLLTLHMAANTDFLKGVGTAGYTSRAWPIKRAATVAGIYDRLERDARGGARITRTLRQLRALSAVWPEQLDAAARNIALADAGAKLEPALLQHANDTLSSIMTLLTALRSQERDQIRAMQMSSQSQLARQKLSLIAAATAGALLLIFAVFTSHRAALSRSASRIVALEAERRFREYFEQHPIAMLIFDVNDLAILTANAAAQRQYDATLQQLRAMSVDELRPLADVEAFRRDLRRYIDSGNRGGSGGVRRHKRADGSIIYVDVAWHLLDYADREACFITAHDVTAHEEAKDTLRVRSRALEATNNAVVISRRIAGEDVITYANGAFERITGHSVREATGAEHWTMLGTDPLSHEALAIRTAMQSANEGSGLLQSVKPDGTPYWIALHVAPVLDDQQRPTHCVTVFSDVSERIRYQEQLRSQANEDALTHLPNRLGLTARLHAMTQLATREHQKMALAFFDLDNFKEINDSLGHTAGDEVLCEVARRLSAHIAQGEVVARYAGDEFVAVLYGRGDLDSFVAAAAAMKESLTHGFLIGNKVVATQASVGVAVFPDHSRDPDVLLKYADSAMYRAKAIGPDSMQVFDQHLATENSARTSLMHALRRAVTQRAFTLAYQPRVNPRTGEAAGFEALVRWNDAERGPVSPAVFIPLAEENGLIVPIGEFVFETACRQTRAWASRYPDIVVSVNVSPVQFVRSDLPRMIAAVLERTGVSPRNIELEITEGVLMAPRSLATLRALREMGLSIAIDDFGSGYSSLGYVRSFMADRLKLDMSFVKGIGRSHADEVIVKAVLALGQTLGMHVVAEGVETRRQLDFLVENGCDEVQGYWFSRPVEAPNALAWLEESRAALDASTKPWSG